MPIQLMMKGDMILTGYLAFLDPPKPSAAPAIKALLEHGVQTKILTGDNEKVTQAVCERLVWISIRCC